MAMRTRKEQVQAYRFITRRLVAALQSGEPETTEMPMRRLGLAVLGSAMLALIIGAVMGVIGFLNPGGATPQAGVLIQEKETTAIYIFDAENEVLYPIVNYASALLILANPEPEIVRMAENSLRDYQRGQPLGIANAPASLPDEDQLLQDTAGWQVCSAKWNAAANALATHVVVGNVSGGEGLGEQGMLVSADVADGVQYLLWDDKRMQIPAGDVATVRAALGMTDVTPTPVSTAVLDSIPAGPDLTSPTLSGNAGVPIDGEATEVGDVFAVGENHYVMTDTGLAPIGEVSKLLLLADDPTVTQMTAGSLASVTATEPAEREGFPQEMPQMVPMSGDRPALCAQYSPGGDGGTTVVRYSDAPAEVPADPSDSRLDTEPGEPGVSQVHHISVPGGRGALVQAAPQPGSTASGPVYLVTDQGMRYPIPATAQASLGYEGVKPVAIPTEILQLLPTGPTMDPAAAKRASGEPAPADEPSGS